MPKPTTKHPAERAQRPLKGTKNGTGPQSTPPATEDAQSIEIPASLLDEILDWVAPLAKTADPTRNLHLATFTGTHFQFSDGIAGVKIPFLGLPNVIVSGPKLFQLAKILGTKKESIITLTHQQRTEFENKLLIQIDEFTATLVGFQTGDLPTWTTEVPTWHDLTENQLAAIKNVSFAISKNPNSLISLQAVALRKGVVMAGNESSRFVLQSSHLPTTVNSLLMDRFLMMLWRRKVNPVHIGFSESKVWVQYEDGAELWGAIPAIPWPSSIDGVIKEFVETTRKIRPNIRWDPVIVPSAIVRVMTLGETTIFVSAKKGTATIQLEAISATNESTETVPLVEDCAESFEVMVDGVMLKDITAITNRMWFLKESNALVFQGTQGIFSVMGIMRK